MECLGPPHRRIGVTRLRLCSCGVPNKAMAPEGPDGRMVPSFSRRTKVLHTCLDCST